MKGLLIKFLINFEIIYDKILTRLTTMPSFSFLKFNKAFWDILYEYKDISINYYINLIMDFKNKLKSKNFWYEIFYNNKESIIINILLYFCFAPIFRFVFKIIGFLFLLIYGLYYLFINLLFDLIIKYLDIYARKWRILYDPLAVEELNDLRKVVLFVGFKENLLEILKKKNDVNLDGVVYKEEFHLRVIRVGMNILLFFIWSLPVFLSFFSYIVRAISVIIQGYCKIFRWYMTIRVARILKRIYLFLGHRLKLYRFRYWLYLRKIMRFKSRLRRKTLVRLSGFYNGMLKSFLTKLYYKVSYKFLLKKLFLRVRLIFGKIYLKFMTNIVYRDRETFTESKIQHRNQYIKYYNIVKTPIDYKFHSKYSFNINLFEIISNIINDRIVNRLKPLAYGIKDINGIKNINQIVGFYDSMVFKYRAIKYGSILNILNYYSIIGGIVFLVNNAISFDVSKFLKLNFFFRRYRFRFLKFKFWFVYHIYYNIFNQLYILMYICYLKIYKYIYYIYVFSTFIIGCFFHLLKIIFKFLKYIFLIIITRTK